jgi:hypothetical protein
VLELALERLIETELALPMGRYPERLIGIGVGVDPSGQRPVVFMLDATVIGMPDWLPTFR